jgi:hypothetical protein
MWGGTSPEFGKLPASWGAYKSVFLGRMKGDLGPDTEMRGVLGNHLASYSLGIDYRLKSYKLKFYWQTILEDKNGRVGVDWKNKGDGLWGISISPPIKVEGINKIILEFFNSTSQSGDIAFSGNDNYFNNGLYRSGWTFREMTIGTPLITSPIFTNRTPEMYYYLDNNCVRAITTGIIYDIYEKQLVAKMTFSRNYGTIERPFNKARGQFFSAIEYTYYSKRYQNLLFSWQGTFDIGSHLGNNAGLLLRLRKTF